jgi:hypothetical protein
MFANLIIKLLSEAAVRSLILAGLKKLAERSEATWDDKFIGTVDDILNEWDDKAYPKSKKGE